MPTTEAKPYRLVSVAALIDNDGRVLLARRPEYKEMPGLWEFPGGKIEPSETPETALIRELSEELAINTITSCLAPIAFSSHAYSDFHLVLLLYACRRWHGEPRPIEGGEVVWVRSARIGDYPMPEASKPLVAMIQDWL